MDDYLIKYFTKEKMFDFTGLINDDFFQPVRILFQNKQYVSATKLLVIAIDSISFIELGNIKENTFKKWLNTYADLNSIGITAEELWEHRNSLLHMSSLKSRKVISGDIRSLMGFLGTIPQNVKLSEDKIGYYDIQKLIFCIAEACGKWGILMKINEKKLIFSLNGMTLSPRMQDC